MKPGQDSAAVSRPPAQGVKEVKEAAKPADATQAKDKDEFVSRKLIRPTLRKVETAGEGAPTGVAVARTRERSARRPLDRTSDRTSDGTNGRNGQTTSEQTHAEDFFYQKQMAAKTVMSVVMKNGEVVQGVIEWYDRNSIKLNRTGKPNLLIYKPSIRYMHKSDESR